MINPSIFKAYDIRGIYPEELDEDVAYKIGGAFVEFIKPKEVMIGRDNRISSLPLFLALTQGVIEKGVDVIDVGEICTDMLYFGVAHFGYGSGIMITASHNPKNYNGMKFVREDAIPISGDTGIYEIRDLVIEGRFGKAGIPGRIKRYDLYEDYKRHVLSFIDPNVIKPYKVVMNAGNGMAGRVIQELVKELPIHVIPMYFEPDGTFPKGEPNPLLPEKRVETIEKVKEECADLGVAWDGDGDRCFFFDEKGNFVEGCFITAILAEALLRKYPGEKIVFDPRLIWANMEVIEKSGGIPIISKCGHAFIKESMRKENALFGGEASAHYYFRKNYFADNGMIPLLLILELMSVSSKPLSVLVEPLTSRYFISGEINLRVSDSYQKMKEIEERYKDGKITYIDGLSIEYPDWRFNLRPSNTEPLVRLNIEAKTQKLMEEKRDELLKMF